MEILKGYKTTAIFPVPSDLTGAQGQVYKNGATVGDSVAAVIADSTAAVPIPYNAVNSAGELEVRLTFNYESTPQELSKFYTVVVPYLELWEIKKIVPNATDDKLFELEAVTRNIINTYCQQDFYPESKSYSIIATSDDNFLTLPTRMTELDSIVSGGISLYDVNNILVDGSFTGQFFFQLQTSGRYIRAIDQDQIPFIDNVTVTINGVIQDPFDGFYTFKRGTEYVVTGKWGWQDIPEPVREAMKLLIEDYSCSQTSYRDGYLVSMSAADWALEFSPNSWQSTGNVRADQLLADYTLMQGGVI